MIQIRVVATLSACSFCKFCCILWERLFLSINGVLLSVLFTKTWGIDLIHVLNVSDISPLNLTSEVTRLSPWQPAAL